jgi:hypothetical protein
MEELKNLLKEDIEKGFCKFQESHKGIKYCPFPVNLDCENYSSDEVIIISKSGISNYKKCKFNGKISI